MFKKVLSVMLSLLLIVGLVACGSGISNEKKQKVMSEIAGVYEHYDSSVTAGIENRYALTLYENGTIEHVIVETKLDGKVLTGGNGGKEKGKWWIEKIEDEYVLIGSQWENDKFEVKIKYSYLNLCLYYMDSDYHKVK